MLVSENVGYKVGSQLVQVRADLGREIKVGNGDKILPPSSGRGRMGREMELVCSH